MSSDLETVRLACGEGLAVGEATAVRAVAPGSGPPVTTAVLVGVTVAFGSRVPVRVQVCEEPAGISTAGQVAVPPLIGQFAPSTPWRMEAPVTPAGTWSVTTTFRARDGPLLVTVTRHWICAPGTTGLVSSVFEMVRLACGEGLLVGEATAVRVEAEGSGPPVTSAVLVGVAVALGSSVPVRVQLAVPFTAISTAGQVAVPPLIGQAVPSWSLAMLAAVTPAGTWSVTTTLRARDGPLLVTLTCHLTCWPGTTGLVSSVLETTRLAWLAGGTGLAVLVQLGEQFGSVVPPGGVTVARLSREPVASAGTVPVRR